MYSTVCKAWCCRGFCWIRTYVVRYIAPMLSMQVSRKIYREVWGRVSVFYLVGWALELEPITLKAISLTFALRPHSVASFAYCYLLELNILSLAPSYVQCSVRVFKGNYYKFCALILNLFYRLDAR